MEKHISIDGVLPHMAKNRSVTTGTAIIDKEYTSHEDVLPLRTQNIWYDTKSTAIMGKEHTSQDFTNKQPCMESNMLL